MASYLPRSPGALRVLFGVYAGAWPLAPCSATSRLHIYSTTGPCTWLAGTQAAALRNSGIPDYNIAVTPAFRKFRVPAAFRCRSNVQPRNHARVVGALCCFLCGFVLCSICCIFLCLTLSRAALANYVVVIYDYDYRGPNPLLG
jgi:hypothetical protein